MYTPTSIWHRYDSQYVLQSKLGFNAKRKQDIINKFKQKEDKNMSQIPFENKVGDQVLLGTPGTIQKLSTLCTEPYPVTNL
jgi:hypothetical protein